MEYGRNGLLHQQNNRSSVVVSITDILRTQPSFSAESSIYRVPNQLRRINPTAYAPQVVSIGPLHHDRNDLKFMEDYKLQCVHSFLIHENLTVEAAIWKVQTWEKRARSCYAETIKMSSDEFVTMMLFDGCFILMLMLRCCNRISRTLQVYPFFYPSLSIDWYRDLTMLENQLPFFVLEGLYNMSSPGIPFRELTLEFFNSIQTCKIPKAVFSDEVNHLVDFMKLCYVPTTLVIEGNRGKVKLLHPPTATNLYEAGVVFKRATEGIRFTDITFINGVLEIPPFEIHDASEAYLRNIMAYEHFRVQNGDVTSYVAFLDGLIDTEKDVSLLVKANIITNHIGSNENVSKLFNDLCKDVFVSGNSHFSSMCDDLRQHCSKRRHRWMVSLRRGLPSPLSVLCCLFSSHSYRPFSQAQPFPSDVLNRALIKSCRSYILFKLYFRNDRFI